MPTPHFFFKIFLVFWPLLALRSGRKFSFILCSVQPCAAEEKSTVFSISHVLIPPYFTHSLAPRSGRNFLIVPTFKHHSKTAARQLMYPVSSIIGHAHLTCMGVPDNRHGHAHPTTMGGHAHLISVFWARPPDLLGHAHELI
jgi:hypothetical protein